MIILGSLTIGSAFNLTITALFLVLILPIFIVRKFQNLSLFLSPFSTFIRINRQVQALMIAFVIVFYIWPEPTALYSKILGNSERILFHEDFSRVFCFPVEFYESLAFSGLMPTSTTSKLLEKVSFDIPEVLKQSRKDYRDEKLEVLLCFVLDSEEGDSIVNV